MVKTSEQDIEKQHEEAVLLVKQGFPCMDNVNHGEISLKWKRHPTFPDPSTVLIEDEEELIENNASSPKDNSEGASVPCFSSRGIIDVGPIVQLVKEGYGEKLKTTLSVIKKSSSASNANRKGNNISRSKLPSPSSVIVKSMRNLWDLNNA